MPGFMFLQQHLRHGLIIRWIVPKKHTNVEARAAGVECGWFVAGKWLTSGYEEESAVPLLNGQQRLLVCVRVCGASVTPMIMPATRLDSIFKSPKTIPGHILSQS